MHGIKSLRLFKMIALSIIIVIIIVVGLAVDSCISVYSYRNFIEACKSDDLDETTHGV